MSLQIGQTLGSYEITSLLGKGGMGEVYRARDSRLRRDVAIKVLPDLFANDPERLARFQREAQVLASLNHPNIAHIYGLEDSNGVRALVMELVEGPTLADRIASGPIPVEEALLIARQIAEAFEAAHEVHVFHRDLKPANIKVRVDGVVKVLDFGLAKALAPALADLPTPTVIPTQVGAIMGTPAYMSPEQARGEAAGPQADIWSFGVVLCELITGASLFLRRTTAETLATVLQTQPDYSVLPSNTPANVRNLIRRCLEKDRKRRVHHIGDVRIEVEEALAAMKTRQRRKGTPRKPARPRIDVPPPPEAPVAEERHLENPYDFSSPANQETFKGREAELDELMDAIRTRTHTAIFGLQRMGKTSLMEEGLRERLEQEPALAKTLLMVNVNFHHEGDDQVKYRDLAGRILRGVTREIAKLGLGQSSDRTDSAIREVLSPARQYDRGDRSEFFERFANCLRGLARTTGRRVILFLDEFSEIVHGINKNRIVSLRNPSREMNLLAQDQYVDAKFLHFFGTLLKDREFTRLYTLVVAVRPFMAEFDERENLQMLKLMTPITLYYLSESQAKALITEPVRPNFTYHPDCVDYLWKLTAGHPYLLQFMLKDIINRVLRAGRHDVRIEDVKSMEDRMISEGTAYEAVFEVLMSDYSVQEVTHPKEADFGKGTMALIAKLGHVQEEGWVLLDQLTPEIVPRHMPKEKLMSVLSQLRRTKILDEREHRRGLQFRVYVPLLRKRFVKQNLYTKYFG
jgi:serine/threonine protein kinase